MRDIRCQRDAQAFEQVDVLVSPTTPFVAFPFGSRTSDPYQMYLADLYTILAMAPGGTSWFVVDRDATAAAPTTLAPAATSVYATA